MIVSAVAASGPENGFPRFRPVGERGLLVEFGEEIATQIHDQVIMLDAALAQAPFAGFAEAVPAYASLLVCFDPLITDHLTVKARILDLIAQGGKAAGSNEEREVEICYDADLAPDLETVMEMTGLGAEEVIQAHLSGDYSVFMYGFAPGYAYLAGVPEAIRLPRKQAAIRDVPAGSVIIAGPQCLVTTLTMPTGWWIIGRSPTRILRDDDKDRPFLFNVGDKVRFRRISRQEFDARLKP